MHKFFQQDLWKTAMMSLGRSNFASLYQSRLGRASRPEAIFKRQGGWKMLCRTGLLPNLKTSKNHFVTKIMCHFARKTICCAGNIVELRSTPFMRSIPIEHSRWLQFAPYFACYFQVQNLAVIARFTWLCWFVILSWAPGHRRSTVSVGWKVDGKLNMLKHGFYGFYGFIWGCMRSRLRSFHRQTSTWTCFGPAYWRF